MSDAFYDALCDHQHLEGYEEGYKDGYEAGKRDADSGLVRCKDCRYFYFGFCHNRDGHVKFSAVRDRDWFCADGRMEMQDESISKFADGEWWKEGC